MFTLHEQTVRVVLQVSFPTVKLSFLIEDAVVVFLFPKEFLAAIGLGGGILVKRRLLLMEDDRSESFVTTGLKAIDDRS